MTTRSPLVLIVDDEPHLLSGLRRVLEKEGYEVTTALDGETALQLAREKKPDVVLLDIMMPGMDGREACRRIREVAEGVQVIYITARAELNDPLQLKRLRSEANAFITKPTTSKRIISAVNGLSRSTRQQPEESQLCRTGQLTKAEDYSQSTEASEDDRRPIR
ncbi:MAG TPA: response regulator [Dehalococcoidia bacterium]|nr:response regulator [Dehalococcoidia bacterium]